MLTATGRRLRRPAAAAAVIVAMSAGVVVATATPAGARPCPSNFICIGDSIFVPRSGGGGAGGGGGCSVGGHGVPCDHPDYGWFVGECDATTWSSAEPDLLDVGGLYVKLPEPGWYDGDPPDDAGSASGGWYLETCVLFTDEGEQNDDPVYFYRSSVWLATSPDAVAILEDLAAEALAMIGPEGADIGLAPSPAGAGLVGLPVWMWTGVSPTTWGPAEATASDGPISVRVEARVESIDWGMGDGTVVTCTTPGTPYSVSYGNVSSPDCGHRYLVPSRDEPEGRYQVTATSHWVAEWEITTGGLTGTIEADRTSQTSVRINELQVLVS